jgi:hypothetical protein
MPPELPPAIAVTTRAGGAMRSSNRNNVPPRKWDRLTTAVYLWTILFGRGASTTARNFLKQKYDHAAPYSDKEIEKFVKDVSETAMESDYVTVQGYYGPWPVEELITLYVKADLNNKAKRAEKLIRNITKLEKIINQAKRNLARM